MTHFFGRFTGRGNVGVAIPVNRQGQDLSDHSYYGGDDPGHDTHLTGPQTTDRRFLHNILKPGDNVVSFLEPVVYEEYRKSPLIVPGTIANSTSVPSGWDGGLAPSMHEKEFIWRRIKSGLGFVP
jgi:hypothetical protein